MFVWKPNTWHLKCNLSCEASHLAYISFYLLKLKPFSQFFHLWSKTCMSLELVCTPCFSAFSSNLFHRMALVTVSPLISLLVSLFFRLFCSCSNYLLVWQTSLLTINLFHNWKLLLCHLEVYLIRTNAAPFLYSIACTLSIIFGDLDGSLAKVLITFL